MLVTAKSEACKSYDADNVRMWCIIGNFQNVYGLHYGLHILLFQ